MIKNFLGEVKGFLRDMKNILLGNIQEIIREVLQTLAKINATVELGLLIGRVAPS